MAKKCNKNALNNRIKPNKYLRIGVKNINNESKVAWAERAYDTDNIDAMMSAQIEEERLNSLKRNKDQKLKSFQNDVQKRVEVFDKVQRINQAEVAKHAADEEDRILRQSAELAKRCFKHTLVTNSHQRNIKQNKACYNSSYYNHDTQKPFTEIDNFSKQKRITNEARRKLQSKKNNTAPRSRLLESPASVGRAGGRLVAETVPPVLKNSASKCKESIVDAYIRMELENEMKESRKSDTVLQLIDRNSSEKVNADVFKSSNPFRIDCIEENIDILDSYPNVKSSDFEKTLNPFRINSNFVTNETTEDKDDKSNYEEAVRTKCSVNGKSVHFDLESNDSNVYWPDTFEEDGPMSVPISERKKSKNNMQIVKVPVIHPNKLNEEEKCRSIYQRATYRRLFMDMEREQVKENKKYLQHQQKATKLKKDKEKERSQLEEEDYYNSLLRDPITGLTEKEMKEKELIELEKQRMLNEELRLKEQKRRESLRFSNALKHNLRERLANKNITLPALCSCAETALDTNPDTCANNCYFYRNPKGFEKALQSLIISCEV